MIDYLRAIKCITTTYTLETTNKNFFRFSFGKDIWLEDNVDKDFMTFSLYGYKCVDFLLDIRKYYKTAKCKLGESEKLTIYV